LITLRGGPYLSTDHDAGELKDHNIMTRLPIHAYEALDRHIEANLFIYFPHDSIPRRLSLLSPTTGQIPDIDVSSVTEQHLPSVIEDRGKGSYRRHPVNMPRLRALIASDVC
jgi:hypothetical protein